MNRETLKTFTLGVLVALSFLLSYILWSYQPKYEMFYDADYISEVDVGGKERTKNDLIRPQQLVFHERHPNGETELLGFNNPSAEYSFYKEIATWSLTNFNMTNVDGESVEPNEAYFIELIFPSVYTGKLLENIFTINEEVELPSWSFDRVFIVVHDDAELSVRINSMDNREQWQATIEKAGAFQTISQYDNTHEDLQAFRHVFLGENKIYLPVTIDKMTKKTLAANQLNPELFTNALFNNPSLVKPNQQKSFFTDGQRGMRIFQGGRYLEFIHPIETNEDRLELPTLIDKSINHINEHQGWINEYHFEKANPLSGKVNYRLHYKGLPIFDFNNLSVIEQVWREQELYQYRRSLLSIGHLLSESEVTLPDSDAVVRWLETNSEDELDKISDIRIGYYLNYIDDAHSITLEPMWFMYSEDSWMRIPFSETSFNNEGIRGE